MKPATLFTVWTPDEVAECLEGVGNTALYTKLWSFVPDYKKRPADAECPPDPGTNALSDFWRRLSPTEQALLNILAERQEKQYGHG